MEIRFLGTGGAFDVAYGNSSALVDCGGKRFLVDCGHSVFPKLFQLNLLETIDAVLITHLHDDHVGSLSTLLFYHKMILGRGKTKIVVPDEAFKALLGDFLTYAVQHPEAVADFIPISDYPQLGAIDTYGQHVETMQTWAYYFVEGKEKLVYSGDNGDAAALFGHFPKLGLQGATVFHEIFFWEGIRAHAYYKDLEKYLPEYPIYGYHCDPKYSPADNTVPLVAQCPQFLI